MKNGAPEALTLEGQEGQVDSEGDRNIAEIRANDVPGAFSGITKSTKLSMGVCYAKVVKALDLTKATNQKGVPVRAVKPQHINGGLTFAGINQLPEPQQRKAPRNAH